MSENLHSLEDAPIKELQLKLRGSHSKKKQHRKSSHVSSNHNKVSFARNKKNNDNTSSFVQCLTKYNQRQSSIEGNSNSGVLEGFFFFFQKENALRKA